MEVDFSAKVQFTSFGPPIAKTCVFTGFLAAQKEKPVFFTAFCNFRNQKLQKAQVFTGFCAGRSHSVRAGSHGMPLGAVPCERARMECSSGPFRASGLKWNVTLESKVNKLRCWNPGSSSWKVCSDFVAEASSERPISENNFYVWGPKIIF